jgi:hypothetical protein
MKKNKNSLNIIITCVVGIAGILIGYFGRGWLEPIVITPNKVVARVEGHNITLKEFQAFAKFYRMQEINTYQQLSQYLTLYQQYGMTPDASISSQINSIQQEFASPTVLGQKVIDLLTENVLIENKAKELGVKVTEDDITKLMYDSFGYYPNGAPTTAPTATEYVSPTYSPTQLAMWATPTSQPTATSTAAATLEATVVATEAQPTATIAPTTASGPTPTIAPTAIPPTATPVTLDSYKQSLSDYMSKITPYGLTEKDLRSFLYNNLLYNKVFTELTKGIATHGEQVWARQILVNQTDAQTAVDELNQGTNWLVVNYNLTTDSNGQTSGGDMGWFPRGVQTAEIDAAVFSMQIGETQIVQDINGWHVLQVIGHEQDRPVSATVLQQMQSTMFNTWLSTAKNNAKIESFDVWKTNVPTVPELVTTSAIQ